MEREFRYTSADFNKIRSLLGQLTGIHLADSKDSLVYSRLVPRLRQLGLSEIRQYIRYLNETDEEREFFINALTTNLTSFFRESHHFDILKDFILSGEPVERIWCAAASSGEEPYSIAMTLVRAFGRFDVPCKLMASDVNSQVLEQAKLGVYPLDSVNSLPDKKNFFYRGKGSKQGLAKVVPDLRKIIEFKRINLLMDEFPRRDSIDVIFCRNVMIYFDKDTQAKILSRLLESLRPGGLYIAGHSENFSQFAELMTPVGRTAYVKK